MKRLKIKGIKNLLILIKGNKKEKRKLNVQKEMIFFFFNVSESL